MIFCILNSSPSLKRTSLHRVCYVLSWFNKNIDCINTLCNRQSLLKKIVLKSAHNEHLDTFMNTFASTFINILMGLFTLQGIMKIEIFSRHWTLAGNFYVSSRKKCLSVFHKINQPNIIHVMLIAANSLHHLSHLHFRFWEIRDQ